MAHDVVSLLWNVARLRGDLSDGILEILRRFRLTSTGRPPRPRMYIMMRPATDVRFEVIRRDGRRAPR